MGNRAPLLVLLGVVAAFVLALSLFGSGVESGVESASDTTSTTFADLPIPDPDVPGTSAPRVETVTPRVAFSAAGEEPQIPGLGNAALVAVVGQGGRGHSLITIDSASWEWRRTELSTIAFDFALDASGRVLSYLGGEDDADTRWVVPVDGTSQPLAMQSGTNSFVWSEDEPLTAAWLEPDAGETEMRVTVGNYTGLGMAPVADLGGTTSVLAGINSAGYWLRFEDPQIPRIGFVGFQPRPGGQGWSTAADLVIPPPSGPRALLAPLDAASWRWNFGLNEDGIIPLAWAPGDAGGEYGFVAFAPDGARIAFIGNDRGVPAGSWVEVWATVGGGAARIPIPYRVWDVGWSPDGKFVVMPGTDNEGTHVVVLLDTRHPGFRGTRTLQVYAIEFDDWVQFAAVVEDLDFGLNAGGPAAS